MKKHMLLSMLLLLTTTVFAQIMENTTVPITGLGEYTFGMSSRKLSELLEVNKGSNSKTSGIFNGESTLVVTNLKMLGYMFDDGSFTFGDDKLKRISFSMSFDKKNKNPQVFEELLAILEKDYGEQKDENKLLKTSFIWQNKDNRMIMLFKTFDKKKSQVILSAMIDILDMNNLEVYEK